jgi:hypothetical protein
MDFVTELPESDRYNAILMIIDRLTKIRYYIVYKTKDQGTLVEQTARIFIEYIWKLHGISKSIVSNRGL